ncbi:uncharacterized protein LOC131940947 isoform X1 [Physella acuta]|uniref:uncharacterized protein LOC131940947 isoform X1 n=1 Tax=Physella acuta TaxID=109671 RepID=UPI0027DB4F62|nr:uncharacterized protein LOC131940947 isoform X1 [Physella acuta]XP_059155861.1 uncharacterized protein LOC131940947 isoform X1 [Physella acuta]
METNIEKQSGHHRTKEARKLPTGSSVTTTQPSKLPQTISTCSNQPDEENREKDKNGLKKKKRKIRKRSVSSCGPSRTRPNLTKIDIEHSENEVDRNRPPVCKKMKKSRDSMSRSRLRSQSRNRPNKVLDLHNFELTKAMIKFFEFLDESNKEYNANNKKLQHRYLSVITGRGLHSKGGVAKIKPAVQAYLDKYNYKHYWKSEGGMVVIDLFKPLSPVQINIEK